MFEREIISAYDSLCRPSRAHIKHWNLCQFFEFRSAPIFAKKKESGKRLFIKSRQVLKESENDAVVSVYSDYFLDPFDEAPQDKTTKRWVIPISFPSRHPPLMRHKHGTLRILNTSVILFVCVKLSFYILICLTWVNHTHSCPSQSWPVRMYTSTLFTSKSNKCRGLVFFSPILIVTTPFFRFPPRITA